MLSAKDRKVGLVGAVASFAIALVCAAIGGWKVVAISGSHGNADPIGFLPACIFVVGWTSASGFGWLRVRNGYLGAYRILALFHTFLCIFTFVAANHILLVVLAPVAIFCEIRHQAIKGTNLDGGSTPANQ